MDKYKSYQIVPGEKCKTTKRTLKVTTLPRACGALSFAERVVDAGQTSQPSRGTAWTTESVQCDLTWGVSASKRLSLWEVGTPLLRAAKWYSANSFKIVREFDHKISNLRKVDFFGGRSPPFITLHPLPPQSPPLPPSLGSEPPESLRKTELGRQ